MEHYNALQACIKGRKFNTWQDCSVIEVRSKFKINCYLWTPIFVFLVMQCTKPSIPSNSRIIYPRTDQVRYTHGTTLYLACHQGHLLTGSPIMVCNCTTWLKREFRCIGMFSTAKKVYYHVTRFTSLTQSCETMIKLTCDLRELVRKSCLATHLRGSVAFSEKVVH